MPWRVLLGLRIKPVINRQICSNPSIRRKTFLKLSIPLARISGTRIIGSMASPFFFYLLTPLIFLHSLIFPNNLPSRVIYSIGMEQCANTDYFFRGGNDNYPRVGFLNEANTIIVVE